MKSLRSLFRFGPGPSSSHSIAPFEAASAFKRFLKEGEPVKVTFYRSLALTGIGHHSDGAIREALEGHEVMFVFDKESDAPHPLTMRFEAASKTVTYFSVGGGALYSEDDPSVNECEVYPFASFEELKEYMKKEGLFDIKDVCLRFEDEGIDDFMTLVAKRMIACVENGLISTGLVPANGNPRLHYERSAGRILEQAYEALPGKGRRTMFLTAYAYAVAESSACREKVVTAPTCGSSGILPSTLYFSIQHDKVPFKRVKDALYTAGMIGNIVKQNASIAGSIGGCQAEVGTASAMAAAAFAYIDKLSLYQIEYAAEAAMEHFLGLSCDPVDGYVIIPCIERNGMGSIHAYSAYLYAKVIAPIHQNQVRFDDVVAAMKLTGEGLGEDYKETALGGLAQVLRNC